MVFLSHSTSCTFSMFNGLSNAWTPAISRAKIAIGIGAKRILSNVCRIGHSRKGRRILLATESIVSLQLQVEDKSSQPGPEQSCQVVLGNSRQQVMSGSWRDSSAIWAVRW